MRRVLVILHLQLKDGFSSLVDGIAHHIPEGFEQVQRPNSIFMHSMSVRINDTIGKLRGEDRIRFARCKAQRRPGATFHGTVDKRAVGVGRQLLQALTDVSPSQIVLIATDFEINTNVLMSGIRELIAPAGNVPRSFFTRPQSHREWYLRRRIQCSPDWPRHVRQGFVRGKVVFARLCVCVSQRCRLSVVPKGLMTWMVAHRTLQNCTLIDGQRCGQLICIVHAIIHTAVCHVLGAVQRRSHVDAWSILLVELRLADLRMHNALARRAEGMADRIWRRVIQVEEHLCSTLTILPECGVQ